MFLAVKHFVTLVCERCNINKAYLLYLLAVTEDMGVVRLKVHVLKAISKGGMCFSKLLTDMLNGEWETSKSPGALTFKRDWLLVCLF